MEAFAFEDSARLLSQHPQPQATARFATVAYEPDAADLGYINTRIAAFLGVGTTDWPAAFRRLAGRYFAAYRRDVGVDTSDPANLERAMYNWSTESRAMVLWNADSWLVLRNLTVDYSGGAHGNHGSSFLVLDRAGDMQTWGLSSIVADTAALLPFLQVAATDRWRLSPNAPLSERLLVDAVPLTKNFYLTRTGLGFVYNPYEIASYADGEVHLFIPYKRIMLLLTEEFRQRMKLGNGATMRG